MREASASRILVARDAILGRVVDDVELSVLCGVHQRPLPPAEAAAVAKSVRRWLRRRGKIPVELLGDGEIGREMIGHWEEAVAELDRKSAIPPRLQNTDGEPLLLTIDQFQVAAGAEAEVERRLAALPGVERQETEAGPPDFVFSRRGNPMHASWENTILGRAWIARGILHLETNSREPADRLRGEIEAACGERIRHRGRQHVDPFSE